MDGNWTFLLVLVTASAAACAIGSRPISERKLHRWSVQFNVLLNDVTEPWTAHQLRRARTIRTVSLVVGINVGMLPMYVNVIDADRASTFSNNLTSQAPFAAAALGAVLAEISLIRRPRGTRSAILETRRWADYIDRFWLVFIAGCLPVSLVAALFATARSGQAARWAWVSPSASCLAILAATLGVHIVVNRPAASTDNDDRRIDDALRADGAHHVVGAAVALAGVATCSSLVAATSGWLAFIPAFFTYAVLGIWYGIARTTRWNVDQARLQRV